MNEQSKKKTNDRLGRQFCEICKRNETKIMQKENDPTHQYEHDI